MSVVRVVIPFHLRNLARVDGELELEVSEPISVAAVVASIEAKYPMLAGTIREYGHGQRRKWLRFFACKEDISHESMDFLLPQPVRDGVEPLLIVGAIAGG
ncbi:MAG: MoaD/ThiS family protein [Chthonomonadales bacterium]